MVQTELVGTLVVALVAASVGGFVAVRLGLPTLVGYLLAGVVIGPYTPGGSADVDIAAELAEVGVILLMFGVGLHFSLRDLWEVRRIAVPGALGQIAVATLLGLGLSQLWGWELDEGIILGLALSVASTVVLLRALEERGLITTTEGRIAVGWLLVEDLFTVVVLILLPALSSSDSDTGGHGLAVSLVGDNPYLAVPLALLQAGLFVIIMLVAGTRVIPRLIEEVDRIGSRELFTLCVLATALGVAFGAAELFGASLALGAFLAGVVLSGSALSHRAGMEALPLREAFAVLFFVSAGMLLDLSIFVDEPLKVISVVAIITLAKALAAFAIIVALGYGIRAGVTVSAALSQVGEFSFILATLAMTLGVFSDEGNSLVLAGAILSIGLNPFVFRQVDAIERWLRGREWLAEVAERRRIEPREA